MTNHELPHDTHPLTDEDRSLIDEVLSAALDNAVSDPDFSDFPAADIERALLRFRGHGK